MEHSTDRERAGLLCYWSSTDERARAIAPNPMVPPRYPGDRDDIDICPGGLIQLPQVVETARAYSWREKGQLGLFYDGHPITDLAKFAIDVFACETVTAQNDSIRERQEK